MVPGSASVSAPAETVVAETVTPDTFVVTKAPLRLHRRTIGDKRLMIVPDPAGHAGTVHVAVPSTMQGAASLDDTQVLAVARHAKTVEARNGRPQDVEWEIEDGILYVLQARPITGS